MHSETVKFDSFLSYSTYHFKVPGKKGLKRNFKSHNIFTPVGQDICGFTYNNIQSYHRDWDSIANILTRLWAGQYRVQFLAGVSSSQRNTQISSEDQPTSCSTCKGGSFLPGKAASCEKIATYFPLALKLRIVGHTLHVVYNVAAHYFIITTHYYIVFYHCNSS
jgi:hypothetical protein